MNTATTLADVKWLLKTKFAIRFSPQAIESEMENTKQNKKSLNDFGKEISELSAKLAAAHVSKGTFTDESAADAIVQPIAVKSFMNGLKVQKTKFFLQARNPLTLTKAISDALEVTNPEEETAMWLYPGTSKSRSNHRGRGQFRGQQSIFRGGYRGRG